jgi:hypothetical protein
VTPLFLAAYSPNASDPWLSSTVISVQTHEDSSESDRCRLRTRNDVPFAFRTALPKDSGMSEPCHNGWPVLADEAIGCVGSVSVGGQG